MFTCCHAEKTICRFRAVWEVLFGWLSLHSRGRLLAAIDASKADRSLLSRMSSS